MAINTSHKARERRLRAKYRRQSVMIGIIALLLGVGLGYLLCVLTTDAPVMEAAATEAPLFATAEPTPEATAVVAEAIATQTIEVTTEAPVAATTEAPAAATEVPAAATEVPAVVGATPETGATDVPAIVSATEIATVVTQIPAAATGAADVPAQAVVQSVDAVDASVAPTAEPTAVPTAEPTAAPIKEPVIVPYGEAATFETQVKTDGTARLMADADSYETLSFTLKVDAYRDPAYFAEQYAASYSLSGTEAAVEFDLTLNGYTGQLDIVPQNVLLITFCNADNTVSTQGYQLMDSEIAGNINVMVDSDKTATLYKRYPFDADQGDMYYMVVNAYNDGVTEPYWFEIIAPEVPDATDAPEASGETLKVGSSGDAVTKLQQKLIDMNLLSGTPDGAFGNYTAEAVRAAQKKLGLEQTGEADPAFLQKLYATDD